MNTREALILLNLTGVVGGQRLGLLAGAFGSPEAAIGRSEAALISAGLGVETAAKVASLRPAMVDRELRLAKNRGARIVTWDEPGYPAPLRNIFDPPLVLYCRGTLEPSDALAIAIVGSRRASLYGLSMADRFGRELAEAGITVVSGMARGIDTSAHAASLKAGGRTIAAMGSGFCRVYPPENRSLADEIASRGCVISEFPMETGPLKQNFPRRNRLISGLSLGVLVVEAANGSGALITADFALEQGRDVFAVPGRVDVPGSSGTHGLIAEGAKLVRCAGDIIEEYPFAAALVPGASSSRETERGKRPVGGDEKLLYDIISGEGASVDELSRRSGIRINRLFGLLLKMQLSRVIRRMPGNRFFRN